MNEKLNVKKEKDLTLKEGVKVAINFYIPIYSFFVKTLGFLIFMSLIFKILGI
jgi:hypothetical protein